MLSVIQELDLYANSTDVIKSMHKELIDFITDFPSLQSVDLPV